MGKNLNGRELGRGLSQRQDGLFSARFTKKDGKRVEKYFKTLAEAKRWLADAKYEDVHKASDDTNSVPFPSEMSEMTVDEWFEFWHGKIICDRAPNTLRNYRERYTRNVQPVIGNLKLSDVRPMHCQIVLNGMEADYAGSTIRQTYICMGTMLRSAVMNGIIQQHPMDGVRYNKPTRAVNDIHFLTLDEQRAFLETARRSHNYYQYALILETGLRTGELIGLTWDAIDWERRTLTVNKTLEFRHKQKYWRAGPPKSNSSYRTIPLTSRAIEILRAVEATRYTRKRSDDLEQVLTYTDRRTGEKRSMTLSDLVFINWRTGMPAKNSSYDTHLYKLCDEAGIDHFCMHALRHTYATRCIEAGINPKTLQTFLGHSSIKMTLDRYVHVTDDSKNLAIQQFEMAYAS